MGKNFKEWVILNENTLQIPLGLTNKKYYIIGIVREQLQFFDINKLFTDENTRLVPIRLMYNNQIEEGEITVSYSYYRDSYRIRFSWCHELRKLMDSIPENKVGEYNIIIEKCNDFYKIDVVKNNF